MLSGSYRGRRLRLFRLSAQRIRLSVGEIVNVGNAEEFHGSWMAGVALSPRSCYNHLLVQHGVKDLKEITTQVTSDPDHNFELLLQLDDLDAAVDIVRSIPEHQFTSPRRSSSPSSHRKNEPKVASQVKALHVLLDAHLQMQQPSQI
ncbi:hypothetical protein JVT61DRAFT_28 [Boletus reticuloceps]|uniref:Uncharacterized protein n=1 Tax=Boletus reticuloceps TaxID=495285 RepID=A0A8I3ADL4_9AGAM|nr:hypothetical protein JVT61DRAFT_28 [Boletus reticuloceps]